MDEVRRFFDQYRETFARYDARELADLFEFPFHVVGEAEGGEVTQTVIGDREDWVGVLEGLLGAYGNLGVAAGEPLELDVSALTARVASARVHWTLRRETGSSIYEFTAFYTLVKTGGAWRVAAIAHDELPKLRAALAQG